MIGFVVSQSTADQVIAGIAAAQIGRGLPVYWTTGAYPIHSGPRMGQMFIPASDEILATPLRGFPPDTPLEFPEAAGLIALLGGLEARVDVDASDLIDPNQTLS